VRGVNPAPAPLMSLATVRPCAAGQDCHGADVSVMSVGHVTLRHTGRCRETKTQRTPLLALLLLPACSCPLVVEPSSSSSFSSGSARPINRIFACMVQERNRAFENSGRRESLEETSHQIRNGWASIRFVKEYFPPPGSPVPRLCSPRFV